MFPEGRTSAVQEKQMTTVMDSNIHSIAIDGSFDDCQSLLKEVFRDLSFKKELKLGAVNSVNWAGFWPKRFIISPYIFSWECRKLFK